MGGRLLGYAFGSEQEDVTVFDALTRQAVETRPIGAGTTWLSNEQHNWDGRLLWTFDVSGGTVQAIGFDPRTRTVARTIATNRRAPAHGLELTADGRSAWINIAPENLIAVINLEAGEVTATVPTGRFP
jgi:hypothetical protein